MVKLLTSYFSLSRRDAEKDFADIKASGFDIVNLPMTEERAMFHDAHYKKLVDIAHKNDLEAWISPWGVLGVFGGEGLTEHLSTCPYSCNARDTMNMWIYAAQVADAIHWDEPKQKCCDLRNILVNEWSPQFNKPQSVYSNLDFDEPYVLPAPSGIFVDIYNNPANINVFKTTFFGPGHTYGVWVKAFRTIGEVVEHSLTRALNADLDYVGVWGYNGCDEVPMLRSSEDTWPTVKQVIRDFKGDNL